MKRLMVWLNLAVAVVAVVCTVWDVSSVNQARAQSVALQVGAQAQRQLIGASSKPRELSGTPVRIVIPSLGIDLQVRAGKFSQQQGTWAVDSKNVDFISQTAPLTNVQGSTFFYGHNANDVLGKTRNIKLGDVAYIYTDNGHTFSYVYQSDVVVKPQDVSVLNGYNLGNPGFKLMTCVGWWDQDRRIMTFTLREAV